MATRVTRLDSIDIIRGVAALSVAGYHYGIGHVAAVASGREVLQFLDWPGAYLAVPVFFVVSGFCIHLGGLRRDRRAPYALPFLLQRIFRIYPAWLLAIGISVLAARLCGTPVTTHQLFTHITLTNGFFEDYSLNPVLWSVSVEMFLYLAYPLWLATRERFGLAVALYFGLLVSVGSNAYMTLTSVPANGPAMWFFLNVWVGWLSGAALAEYWVKQNGRPIPSKWWVTATIASLAHIALVVENAYTGTFRYALIPITICVSVVPVGAVIWWSEPLRRLSSKYAGSAWRCITLVGAFSYSLYLLHEPLFNLRFEMGSVAGHSEFAKAALFIGWFALVLAASWLSYRYIEMPTYRYGHRLSAALRQRLLSRRIIVAPQICD
jgi:peptidoglycan/LPS O-acetylase OafA/YrhL